MFKKENTTLSSNGKNTFRFILFFIMIFFTHAVYAQSLSDAKRYFKNQEYQKALAIYEKSSKTEKNPEYLLQRAISYYYLDQIDASLADLKKHQSFFTDDIEFWKYLGLAHCKQLKYSDGAKALKKYLSFLKPEHADYHSTIENIRRSGLALGIMRQSKMAFVENVGSLINSPGIETKPVYSPNYQDRIYFSSNREGSTGGKRNAEGLIDEENGHYFTDMYYSDFIEGNWTHPTTFLPLLNTPKNDYVMDFNNEGNILYYGVTMDNATFVYFSDTFNTENNYANLPVKVDLPPKGEQSDKDFFIFNDSLIIFSSKQLSGYGGFDLFYTQKNNGVWGEPINFGPSINSGYDEIAPFMSKAGKTLYFSSNRLEGLGGFDIFYIEFDKVKKNWNTPVNMGLPINSPWDENYFIISSDGMHGIYSSKKAGGYGDWDLYIAYFTEQVIEQLLFTEYPDFLRIDPLELVAEQNITPIENTKKEILLKSLFYTTNDDVLSQANVNQLNKLVENLLIIPELTLTIYSHSFQETGRDMDLYLSLKRAEIIKEYLMLKGVPGNRITIKALGSSYPLATPYINGIKSNIAEKNNKRIDFGIEGNHAGIKIYQETPSIPEPFIDEKLKLLKMAEDTFVFRLLIAQTQQMYRSEVINLYDEIMIEKTDHQTSNQYLLGNFYYYNEADHLKKELADQYNIKAVIIPYFKGKPLPESEFMQKIGDIPELILFMRHDK